MKKYLWLALVSMFFCLSPAYTQKLATQFDPPTDQKIREGLFELHMFPGWFKPLCDQKQYKGSSRLVVKLLDTETAILNPPGEIGYPPDAIDLHGLSLEDAKNVWGDPRGMTFDLLSQTRGSEMDVYHLDTKFVNGKLASYRLRGIGISKPQWISIE